MGRSSRVRRFRQLAERRLLLLVQTSQALPKSGCAAAAQMQGTAGLPVRRWAAGKAKRGAAKRGAVNTPADLVAVNPTVETAPGRTVPRMQ